MGGYDAEAGEAQPFDDATLFEDREDAAVGDEDTWYWNDLDELGGGERRTASFDDDTGIPGPTRQRTGSS